MATGQRIYWEADSDPDTAYYEVRRANTPSENFEIIVTVDHAVPGPNWSASQQKMYYDDVNGLPSQVYQVTAVSTGNVAIGLTAPFYAFGQTAVVSERVAVDHNYQGTDSLQFVTESGQGIPDATIRIYYKSDYDVGKVSAPVYTVQTDSNGRWRRPAYLLAGSDYIIVMDKYGAYVSDPTQITV